MQDQPSPAERLDVAEREVLYALAAEDGTQSIWTVDELGREIESAEDARIAVRSLHRAGLVHFLGEDIVIAARPGVRVVEMLGHVT
jgi:hypothetical protein